MTGEYYTYTLPNGIRCIYKRVTGDVAHCAVAINAGSRDELHGQEGLAHFTEHGLFKGTTNRRAYHINCRLENLGGELNAYTSKEETVVHATTLRRDFAVAVELLSDIVFNATFPAAEMDMEKTVILDEINAYKDTPQERIWDEFEDLFFTGSPLGHNILGTRASLKRQNRDTIEGFKRRTYNTDQMVFSTAGDLSEKSFRNVADRYFGSQTSSMRDFTRIVPARSVRFEKIIGHRNHQAHCIIGGRAYDAYDPQRLVLSLLINLIGGPAANSLLNVSLREKQGLTYNVEASYTPLSDSGLAAIYFSSEKERIGQCIELINKQLDIIKRTPLSDRKLSMAKKQFIGQISISAESNENSMLGAGKSFMLYNHVESTETICRRIGKLTAKQVMDAANEIFSDMSTLIYK